MLREKNHVLYLVRSTRCTRDFLHLGVLMALEQLRRQKSVTQSDATVQKNNGLIWVSKAHNGFCLNLKP